MFGGFNQALSRRCGEDWVGGLRARPAWLARYQAGRFIDRVVPRGV